MIDYVCAMCGKTSPVSPGYTKKKKKCPECGDPITAEELDRQYNLWQEAQQQKKNRKMLLPLLLGLAILVSVFIGVFAKNIMWFYIATPVLIGGAALLYRKTMTWI